MSEKKIKTIGAVWSNRSLFMRISVGEATGLDTGTVYELSTSVPRGEPMIRSKTTGQFWSVDWPALINLAIAAGIDVPLEAQS